MDERSWAVVDAMRDFMDEVVAKSRERQAEGGAPRLAAVLAEHLGCDPRGLPIVRLEVQAHQFVNLDVAVAAMVDEHGGGTLVGVGGGMQRHHQTLGDMLQDLPGWSMTVGPVDRTSVATGPDSTRDAVAMGVHLFRYRDVPVAMLQRSTSPQFGNPTGLEIVAAQPVSDDVVADVRRLMVERSVFRGQMLSFGLTDGAYGAVTGGIAFVSRPQIAAADVVLPAGALARIERHIAGAARHRETLRAAGQHLKRGLLLYGPPGTGKTHTVRYLVGQLPGVTVVVLAGGALALVAEATELARALEPAVVVMEDIDLIAEHREYHMGPQPLLFTLLDAMDGLAADVDVAFVLTTNRADLLESALTQRPGRIDLAMEVPLPDRAGRRALLDLYVRQLPFSAAALDAAAARTEGVTASFFKELARRTVLVATDAGRPVDDGALGACLTEMLSDGERLSRALIGGVAPKDAQPNADARAFLRRMDDDDLDP